MDFTGIELWIFRGTATILLCIAAFQLILRSLAGLLSDARRVKDIIIETKSGTVTVSVNPDSEESVRALLNKVAETGGEESKGGERRSE
jgi:hypothetical protein